MNKIPMMKLFVFLLVLNIPNIAIAAGGSSSKATSSKYFKISPQTVVNISDKGKVRHLQVGVQLRLDEPGDSSIVEEHIPAIQHELVMLLSGREAQNVRSVQGKELLRTEAMEKIKIVLEENTGRAIINAVYFTAFVIQ